MNRPRLIRLFLMISFLGVLVTGKLGAGGPADTDINQKYGPAVVPMPYNGQNGYAVVGALQNATSTIGNGFNSAFRGDTNAMTGGAYNGSTQTGFFGFNGQGTMVTQGQLGAGWGSENALGKGNAFFGNGVAQCYGGGEVDLPSSTPECVALGEFDAFQGGLGGYVWSATVTGSPASGATTINYTSPTNNQVLGARAILNLSHVTGGTGTISSFTQCAPGSGSPCPTNCPEGAGSSCTIVQFSGSTIDTTAGRQWYFKTAPSQNDYYNPACTGDDILFPNAGGPSVPKCIGHWYKVATVNSATEITLYGSFDQTNIGTYLTTADYVMIEGIEATDVNQTANTITLPANSMQWNNSDFIYSPPSHYMVFNGINLIFDKVFKTGSDSAPSYGLSVDNEGTGRMDTGVIVQGISSAFGGFRVGVDLVNLNIVGSVPAGSGEVINDTIGFRISSNVNYGFLMRDGTSSPAVATNQFAFGNNGESIILHDATTDTTMITGVDANIGLGVYNDGGGLKHSRVTTGSVGASAFVTVVVTWTTAFINNSYTPTCTVIDASGNLTVAQISALAAGSITVDIKNGDSVNPHTGTISCIAMHD